MSSIGRFLAVAGLFLGAALALQLADATTVPPRKAPPAPMAPPPAPDLSPSELNQQDRVDAAHERAEDAAFDGRPLLALLPLSLAGVRIHITGLAADQRTALLTVSAGPRGLRYAQALYRRTLAALDDDGSAYEARWKP